MSLDILHNSTSNSTTSLGTDDFFMMCNNMRKLVWACFSSVCVLFGFPACVAVLWELLQRHRRGIPATPNNVFMLNLTVMDFVFLSFLPLGILNALFWYIWPIQVVFNFVYAFTMTGRPLLMSCICLDCYLAVVHPITYRARKGLTPRVLMSIGVWAVTLVYGGLFVRFDIAMTKHPVGVLPYVVTISIIGVCDFFIFRALKSPVPGERGLHPQKKKALQIIVNSLVLTLIAYLPPILIFCVYSSYSMSDLEFYCEVGSLTLFCAPAASAIMPVLYLSNLGKLDKILPCKRA